MPPTVTIVEVGPRDGLQNEAAAVQTVDKVTFVNLLSAPAFRSIEVSAFVSPKWVPQMADASGVFAGISRRPGVRYPALVPNLAGLERAHAAGVTEVAIFAAASETFSRQQHQSGHRRLARWPIAASARGRRPSGCRVRAYVSTAFGCPFEGRRPAGTRRLRSARRSSRWAPFEVSVSDTIGIAHPGQIPEVLNAVAARVPLAAIALHFHDTRGTALANVLTALQMGVVHVRFVGGRSRRMSLRAGSDRQPRD